MRQRIHFSQRKVFSQRKAHGFTLVELLITMAVIGILASILLPVAQTIRATARRTSCQNNVRQLMTSITDFEIINQRFPKAVDGRGGSMFVELLPHLEQKFLLKRSLEELATGETYSQRMAELSTKPIELLFCPSSTDETRQTNTAGQGEYSTNYVGVMGPVGTATSSDGVDTYNYQSMAPVPTGGNVGLDGMFSPASNGQFSIGRGNQDALDGAANTLAVGEVSRFMILDSGAPAKRAGWAFGAVYDSATDELTEVYSAKSVEFEINSAKGIVNNVSFASSHPSGANFGFADMSTRFIKDTVSVDILKTIASTNHTEQPERFVDN